MRDQVDAYHFRNAYACARGDAEAGKNKLADRKSRSKTDNIYFAKPAWCGGYALGVRSVMWGEKRMTPNELTAAYEEWATAREGVEAAEMRALGVIEHTRRQREAR
jgi:hypothetical protein